MSWIEIIVTATGAMAESFMGSDLLERLRYRKRIYLYGAGRAGKSSFWKTLAYTDLPHEDLIEEEKYGTIGREGDKIVGPRVDFGPEYNDVIIFLHSFGGQQSAKEQRQKHFIQALPDSVIVVLSPFLRFEAGGRERDNPLRAAIQQNRAAINDLFEIFQNEEKVREKCKYIIPTISHKNEWGNMNYSDIFREAFHEDFQKFTTLDTDITIGRWQSHDFKERPSVINVVKVLLRDSGKGEFSPFRK